ncbi:MAG: hypothetical protein ABSC94_14990 [Polyangiaceae bacterium]|jgi:hypothetical protein
MALLRVRGAKAFSLALLGAVLGALAPACITTDLPPEPISRPTILHDAVQPPADQILFSWPEFDSFSVPVEPGNPNDGFVWDVFVDFDINPAPANAGVVSPDSYSADGGVVIVSYFLSQPPATSCHRIDFLVAHAFASLSDGAPLDHTPSAIGGDQVTWFYMPGGSPDGCPAYDAGVYEDGAFPPPEASAEGGP